MKTNKKYRIFGIPVFDIVIVLVILALLLGAYLILFSKGKTTSTQATTKIKYTLVYEGCLSSTVHNIKTGDVIKDFTTNFEVGKITSFREEPYVSYSFDAKDAKAVKTEFADRKNIVVEVEADAIITDSTTKVNDVQIYLSKEFDTRSAGIAGSAVVTKLDIGDGRGDK